MRKGIRQRIVSISLRKNPIMFTKIPDDHIKNFWICQDCSTEVEIMPDWYEQNGTPVCGGCDIDMEYSHSEGWIDG